MKRFIYIPFLVAVSLLVSSCNKGLDDYSSPDEEWTVFNGYMQFNTNVFDGVSTRAALAENMRSKSFGVMGYAYSTTTSWDAAKALETPTIFYNQKVDCGSSGICTYDIDRNTEGDQMKLWESNIYSFFAYQPYGGPEIGITLSESYDVNTPTLTYTYGWLGDVANTITAYNNDNIFDLMTAEDVDIDGRNPSNVNLEFKHRLFAIEVLANNFNETVYKTYYYTYQRDTEGNIVTDENGVIQCVTDENGNKVLYESGDVVAKDDKGNILYILDADGKKQIVTNKSQKITDLKLKISGLKHTSMTIPMSMADGEAEPTYTDGTNTDGTIGDVTFQLSNQEVYIPAFNETVTDADGTVRGEGVASSISKLGSANQEGYLMLIPQSTGLDFEFDWKELVTLEENSEAELQTSFESSMEFKAGLLYQIIINFVGDGITIAIIEAGAWEVHDVYHTFE